MMKKYDNENGMALIFAIGLLSLLLMIGLTFIGNAVGHRRVAENNSARTQSRMLAMSAVSRAAMSLMIYSHQYALANSGDFPENFNHIYSYGKYDKDNGSAVHAAEGISFTDGLLKKSYSESVMKVPNNGSALSKTEAARFNIPFDTSNSHAVWPGNWVFFFNGNSSSRRIIGRAAWQVIGSSAELLAPVFMRGHVEKIDPCDDDFKARDHRWGREIDEVYLDPATVFSNVYGTGGVIPDKDAQIIDYEPIYTAVGAGGNGEKQRWIEKWLLPDPDSARTVENPSTVKAESYSNGRYSLYRFNISELWQGAYSDYDSWQKAYKTGTAADPWYARLGIDSVGTSADKMNGETAITRLTCDALPCEGEYDYEVVREAEAEDDYSGLPYLRRIGNATTESDYISFGDIADLRKQIAANFNDYCDADSVPTSDVKASEWSITDPAKYPKYTGNEKTLYINELALGIGGVELSFDKTTRKLEISEIKARLFAELVKIYGGDDELLKPANLIADVALKKLTFKVAVSMSLTVKISYTRTHKSGGKTTVTTENKMITVPINPDYANTADAAATVEFTDAAGSAKQTIGTFAASDPVNGYYLGKSDAFSIKGSGNIEIGKVGTGDSTFPGFVNDTINTQAASELPANTSEDSYSFTNDNYEITGASIGFKILPNSATAPFAVAFFPVLLKKSGTGGFGVDFVKFDPAKDMTVTGTPSAIASAAVDAAGKVKFSQVHFIGGFEARDPRQNLNVYYDSTNPQPQKSDWDITPTVNVDAAPAGMSMTVAANEGTDSGQWGNLPTAGGKNRSAIPSAPKYISESGVPTALGTGTYDTETAVDPAWLAETTGSNISTAHIRNAPMMSPWEIGFIHRGIRWQTINIKKASNFDFSDNNNDWNKTGSVYANGDGAILEQIKMTDQVSTYGKINVNLLRTNHQDYRPEDKDVAKALFRGIYDGELPNRFIANTTRIASGTDKDKFPSSPVYGEATQIDADEAETIADNLVVSRGNMSSRSAFLNWSTGGLSLENGFLADIKAAQTTDAAKEEIIGKTINLLDASISSPSIVRVAVVAQSIRDLDGEQVRVTEETEKTKFKDPNGTAEVSIDDGTVSKDCALGRFDMFEHTTDDNRNVYFDEITGEVKMFVTFYRDTATGRMKIIRIDYL